MKRKIIRFNLDLCNGCGLCIPNCPEGAIQVIDGKARLVSDLFCDGLGACLGHCPLGAIETEEREAEAYNEAIVMENIIKQGKNTILAHLYHLDEHGEKEFLKTAMDVLKNKGIIVDFIPKKQEESKTESGDSNPLSELRQWPVQLALINPKSPFLQDADLLIAADCAAFTDPNFHQILKGKRLVVFCPKFEKELNRGLEKIVEILEDRNIQSITVARVNDDCCEQITGLIEKAIQKSNKKLQIREIIIHKPN